MDPQPQNEGTDSQRRRDVLESCSQGLGEAFAGLVKCYDQLKSVNNDLMGEAYKGVLKRYYNELKYIEHQMHVHLVAMAGCK